MRSSWRQLLYPLNLLMVALVFYACALLPTALIASWLGSQPSPTSVAVTSRPPITTWPLEITDDLERTVNIEQIPQRIVSLAPSITEILFALDLGDRIVGVTDHCDYPEEALTKPKVGGYFMTNLEAIMSQKPDIVFTDGHDPVCEQLEGLGVTMVVLQPKDIAGIFQDIELVGQITGKEEEAEKLINKMQSRISTVAAKTAGVGRPTVFYVVDVSDPSKPWTAGSGSFVDALIGLAGGQNIAATAGQWSQFSLEVLVSVDPEIIIVDASHGEAFVPDFGSLPGWNEMSAVKEGKIYLIDGDLTSRPGPRIVEGLEEMARIIHPELFGE